MSVRRSDVKTLTPSPSADFLFQRPLGTRSTPGFTESEIRANIL